jgi:predicted transcriptional regulator of viral defense system
MQDFGISQWINERQRSGYYSFIRSEAEEDLRISRQAMSKSLDRLQNRNRIRRIRRQFYVILPVEYEQIGMIPPDWFIDELMEYLGESYYMGLLTAAGLQGAGHQQVQEYQVVVNKYLPPIRLTSLSIRFFYKLTMGKTPLNQIKGHSGMLPVSTPAATALDLVRYATRIGGIDSAATVLTELSEVMQPEDLRNCSRVEPLLSVIQRLGWIMDELGEMKLAEVLYNQLKKVGKAPPRALLDPSGPRIGNGANRWKVTQNTNLDLDI